ncbi:MAG: radical SAM protein [Candidatus Woesearchaeota archaeon]
MPDYCIWNLCNSNCIMCTNPFGFRSKRLSEPYNADEILSRIKSDPKRIKNPQEEIILTGGEPTIHPEFMDIIHGLREEFPNNTIAFASNGRRFFYKDFVKELLKVNNLQMHVVMHSANEKVHDGITRTPGSFKQTFNGLKNIFKYKNDSHRVELRVVLLKQNYKEINDIYNLFYKNFPSVFRISTIFPEYEGRAEKNFDSIKITYPEVKPYVEDAIRKWGNKFRNFYFYHFPLCTIDSDYWEHLVRSLPPEHDEIEFLDKCDDCVYKKSCLSVYKDYVKHFGKDHFNPITKKINGVIQKEDDYHYPIKIK